MKRRLAHHILLVAAVGLAGCGGSTSSQSPMGARSSAADDAQIAQVLQSNPQYVNESVWQDETPIPLTTSFGFAAIQPRRFSRKIQSVETTTDIEYSNPDSLGRPLLARVTIHRHLQGTFNIMTGSGDDDSARAVIRKPLDDDWTRKIELMRRPTRRDTGLTRWRLVGTSGVDVRTRGGDTRVTSLRIQSGTLDTTITDPLELHRLRRVIRVNEDAAVLLTATTDDTSDVVLFHGFGLRRRFTNNGDGTHSIRFPADRFPDVRHFGVDALSRGSLFDDTEPYDANAWILAYVQKRERLDDDDHDDD